jgi:transcription antitermination factor NusG
LLAPILHQEKEMSFHSEEPETPEPSRSFEHAWYVLHVRANREKSVALTLRQRGFTEFLPLYAESHHWSDRLKAVQVPLFPGYVFCSFDLKYRLPILSVPWVIGVVGLRGVPQPVLESEIAAVRKAVTSGLQLQPWPFLEVGERLIIQSGPLRHVEGILSEIKGDLKLIISVTLLQRSIALQVERADVRPAASQLACAIACGALSSGAIRQFKKN